MRACQDAEVPRLWLSVAGSSVLMIGETSDSSDSLLQCPLRGHTRWPVTTYFQTAEPWRMKSLLQKLLRLLTCKNVFLPKNRPQHLSDLWRRLGQGMPKRLFTSGKKPPFGKWAETAMRGHSKRKSLSNLCVLEVIGTHHSDERFPVFRLKTTLWKRWRLRNSIDSLASPRKIEHWCLDTNLSFRMAGNTRGKGQK